MMDVMGWFSRRLSGSQKEGALILVSHLQTMLAYQQLAMETYNDALASASGRVKITGGEEAVFSNPTLVAEYVIPAVEKKIEIFQLMEKKHQEASVLATANLQQPYQEMTALINTLLARAQLQYQGFKQWVNNQEASIDVTRLDGYEREAIVRATTALNETIIKIGLTSDEWLDVGQEAINSVRASLKLVPLSRDTFRSQYFRLINGEHIRFFAD